LLRRFLNHLASLYTGASIILLSTS